MMQHLTSTNPALEAAYRATPPGMAHWAGSGPVGRTCGQCLYLVGHKRKHHRCYKYFQLMGRWSGEIARVTASCRHFEAITKENGHAAYGCVAEYLLRKRIDRQSTELF